jgi:protein gp37
MSDNTKIEWADATVNAVNGCSLASPGCTNCYAMKLAGTRLRHHPSRAGLTQDSKAGPVWTGEVRLNEKALLDPLKWKRPRRIFWNAHGDLFHPAVPDEWIDRVFAVCALTPQHQHMILTKRSARMREFFRESTGWRARIAGLLNDLKPSTRWNGNVYQGWQNLHGKPDGLPNVWLGVSVEDQTRADERIPDLLATPAAVRFISAEPLLGPVDLKAVKHPTVGGAFVDALRGLEWSPPDPTFGVSVSMGPTNWTPEQGPSRLQWVIVGGESGPGARPMHPDWARSLRDQCAAAGTAFHFKQWGEWVNGLDAPADWNGPSQLLREPSNMFMARIGKKAAGRLLDGVEHNACPELGRRGCPA